MSWLSRCERQGRMTDNDLIKEKEWGLMAPLFGLRTG
jgi:hypothetical protein